MLRIDLNGYLIIINKGGDIMKVYIVIEIYFSEEKKKVKITGACGDTNAASDTISVSGTPSCQ